MVYKPTIPQPTDIPAASQADILENFTQLNTQFSAEHVALNAGAANGQHLAVTLPRSPTVAAPAGTDWQLIHSLNGGKDTLDIKYAGPAFLAIPLRHLISPIAVAAGAGTRNLVDFATVPYLGNNASGTVYIYDVASPTRSVWSTFVYIAGVLYIAGGAGQLATGTQLTGFTSAGSVLQVTTGAGWGGGNVTLVITESRTL